MIQMMRTAAAVGASSSVARASLMQRGLGYGWLPVANPCDHSDFAKAITTNKRQPRRLGQRTT
jgi:hypothetical protein